METALVVLTFATGAFCRSIRGSTCCRVLNVGAGGPGGMRLPWANADDVRGKVQADRTRTTSFIMAGCAHAEVSKRGLRAAGGI